MSRHDSVHVSIEVPMPPQEAFSLFTEEVDLWWRRDIAYRVRADSFLRFEPGEAGRFVEVLADGRSRTIGAIEAWEPGRRLCFEWRGVNFRPEQVTHVEVLFDASEDGCTVTVHHRGWSTLPDDHPAFHGRGLAVFIGNCAQWWARLLTDMRKRGNP